MLKNATAPRHRAVPAKGATASALAQTVTENAGTFGRQAAVLAATSGLALTFTVPAAQAAPVSAERETSVLPATGADVERTAKSESVVVDADVEVELARVEVTSTPAPVEEETPEVENEAAAYTAADAAREQQQGGQQTQQQSTSQESSSQQVDTASSEPAQQQAAPANTASGAMGAVVSAAYSGIGSPYVYGGKGPGGWDCSGFTSWAYAQAGLNIPSSTSAILGSGKFVRTSNPQPGDLVFQNGGGHVGIYVGNGQMIGAQNPSVGTILHSVTRNPLYGYYTYVG